MQVLPNLLALLIVTFGIQVPMKCVALDDGQIVQGHDFEGVIFTPKMLQLGRYQTIVANLSDPGGIWTPSADLVLKAESALPGAIAKKTKYPKPTRGEHYPTYYTAKNATDLNLSTKPVAPSNISDSDYEDNFLYDLSSYFKKQKRQYLGITEKGRRYLLIHFISPQVGGSDTLLAQWKHEWIAVLDGGWYFWSVRYDPVTGKFSEWNCGGFG